jgi:hypothetical protein
MSYSNKNSLKVFVSNATGPSVATTLATLPVGEIGFFTAAGAAIATTGTGHLCYRRADGQVIMSDQVTFASAWKSSIKAYAAPTMEVQTVTFSTATASTLYQVRLEMKLPGMNGSYIKHGNYVSAASGDTTTTIATALAASLNKALAREDKEYFTITSGAGTVIVTAKSLPYVRGKKSGHPVWFKTSLIYPEALAVNGALTATPSDGIGYGPYICEKEFFAQGDSDAFRFREWPNSFDDRALAGVSTGRYDVLPVSINNAKHTANADVYANQDYLLAFNTIGVGTVPTLVAPDVDAGTASGTGTYGDTVYIYDNGTLATGTNSAVVASNGTWAISAGLTGITAGHTATAVAVAPGGGTSASSIGVTIVA